jgi:hypothetical protein
MLERSIQQSALKMRHHRCILVKIMVLIEIVFYSRQACYSSMQMVFFLLVFIV